MDWYSIARAGELPVGGMKRVEVAGLRLLVCHAEDGHYCIDEMCSHEDYSLWFGCIKGRTIKCSLHGSFFSLEDGQPLNAPADCALRTYPTKAEDGLIWVQV